MLFSHSGSIVDSYCFGIYYQHVLSFVSCFFGVMMWMAIGLHNPAHLHRH